MFEFEDREANREEQWAMTCRLFLGGGFQGLGLTRRLRGLS